METASAAIPAHVPPHLVYDFDFFTTPALFEFPQGGVATTLHRDAPRIFFTPRNGGHWVVTRKADIVEMCRDYGTFPVDPQFNWFRRQKPVRFLPKDYDPPEHTSARAIFAPVFSPTAVAKMEPSIQQLAAELIEEIVERRRCEFVSEIAELFPVTIFLQLANAPLDHRAEMVQHSHQFFRAQDPEVSRGAMGQLGLLLGAMIEERRKHLGEDLLSRIVAGRLMDRPLTNDEILGGAVFTFLAGLDTVTSMLTFMMKFLAGRPDLYKQLVDDPNRVGRAVEELIRISSVALIERGVREDVVFKEVPFRRDDRIVMLLQISGMDDEGIEDPLKVDFDRRISGHLAFGSGAHRCLGSHLARIEMRVFLEEWIRRIPKFGIADNENIRVRGGTVWLPECLPLKW